MSTEPVFIFEHRQTKTILRSISSGNTLLVIRDLKETARYPMHLNYAPSCSENGIVYFHNGYGRHTLDLNLPFPQEPRKAADGNIIHPSGNFIIKYAMKEYPHKHKENKSAGLLLIDIHTGEPQTLWEGDTSDPRLVPLFGQTAEEAAEEEPYSDRFKKMKKPIEFPRVLFSSDGNLWALIQTDRMEIGQGSQRTASVHWNPFAFFPIKAAFDSENKRLILSGKDGILSFHLNGEICAFWKAELPCEPFLEYGRTVTKTLSPAVSPPLIYHNEIISVICTKKARSYPDPSWYEILRFDRDTLSLRGKLEGMPRRRDPDDNASLYELSDGSLVWAPNTQPLLILPADGAEYRSTELAKIAGEEEPPRIPHPAESWYIREIGEKGDIDKISRTDENQRKSLARYLLNELLEDRRFTELLETDRRAFSPYIDQIADWDEDRLKLFSEMDWRNFWKIMDGLSDESVHKIADRLRAKKKITEEDSVSIMLLIGAGTDAALSVLNELAQKSRTVRELCSDHHLMITEKGPAVKRMTPESLDIVAYPSNEKNQEGLEFPLSHSEYLPEKFGWGCRSPMGHILSMNLDLLPSGDLKQSPLRWHHFFLSSGEECCDEILCTYYAYRNTEGSDRLVELIADLAASEPKQRPEDSDCEGSEETEFPEKEYMIVLEPHSPERDRKIKRLGKLGGWPEWWQSPEILSCPECGKMMFYIGCVYADTLRNDMPDAALYGFHCEDCGIGAQAVQIT
ncbi:MAG TPA: hypothetical protein PK453_16800 [Leptospiraceae bacterium]|nr:hypothetical protein [Leptospiraceae bacterium]